MQFEILEHPADIGFRAYGATVSEVFENAALALMSIASEPESVEPREEYRLDGTGSDYESLLVGWLNEVLYFYDGKRITFRRFRVSEVEPERIAAVGLGEPRDAARHVSKLIVKAVTWHQLKVFQEADDGWIAQAYLDI